METSNYKIGKMCRYIDVKTLILLISFAFLEHAAGVPHPTGSSNRCVMPHSTLQSKYSLAGNLQVGPGEVVAIHSTLKLDCSINTYPTTENIICEEQGWSSKIPVCNHCGTITEGVVDLNGEIIKSEDTPFPWHATIYRKTEKEEHGPPQYLCAGNIINRNMIVAVAHCVYDNREGKLLDPSSFIVAVGKRFRDFNHIEEKKANIQNAMVNDIKIPDSYSGGSSNYGSDMSILILDQPLNFTETVSPVCLDIDDDHTSNEVDAKFSRLRADNVVPGSIVPLRILNHRDCREKTPKEFQAFILNDKICAIPLNDTSFCKGDSGGGVFVSAPVESTQRWFLKGLLSTSPVTDFDKFCWTGVPATFTSLSHHSSFIKKSIS